MTSHNFMVKLTLPSVTLSHKSRIPLPKLRHKLTVPSPFKKALIIACRNKSDFSFLISTSAVNVTLFTFADECRAVASAAVPLGVYAWRSSTNLPHVGLRSHDGTDIWTDARSCHRLCSFCSHAAGCSIVIPSAICDPCVYSAYQQLPVYFA